MKTSQRSICNIDNITVPQIWWTGCFCGGRRRTRRCTWVSAGTGTEHRRLSWETGLQSMTCYAVALLPCAPWRRHTASTANQHSPVKQTHNLIHCRVQIQYQRSQQLTTDGYLVSAEMQWVGHNWPCSQTSDSACGSCNDCSRTGNAAARHVISASATKHRHSNCVSEILQLSFISQNLCLVLLCKKNILQYLPLVHLLLSLLLLHHIGYNYTCQTVGSSALSFSECVRYSMQN